jgi:FMN phosphatase YigB (HAD superfamily)
MISHILFDLGNVLIPLRWDRTYDLLEPLLTPEHAALLRRNPREFKDKFLTHSLALERGEIEFDEFLRLTSIILGTELTAPEFERIWCSMFSLDERIVELGECLSRNYGTWLVSNTSRIHYEFIVAEYPRVKFYRDAALSYKFGVMKPDLEYYRKAIAQFGINPADAVFIDDLPENVEGSVKAGMKGIVYRGYSRLLEELEDLGVDVSCVTERCNEY